MPQTLSHLSVIPDGNRRWAGRMGVSVTQGYRAGADKMLEVVIWCLQRRIANLSAFVLSKDNSRKRPEEQLVAIHQAAVYFLREAYKLGASIRLFGDIQDLDPLFGRDDFLSLQSLDHPKAKLVFYGLVNHSRWDDVTGVPDVDLLIRTGNSKRLDGFLPLQVAESEILFLSKLWPNFSYRDFASAIKWYGYQIRTHGK